MAGIDNNEIIRRLREALDCLVEEETEEHAIILLEDLIEKVEK